MSGAFKLLANAHGIAPGWYYFIDAESMVGPFPTREACETAACAVA